MSSIRASEFQPIGVEVTTTSNQLVVVQWGDIGRFALNRARRWVCDGVFHPSAAIGVTHAESVLDQLGRVQSLNFIQVRAIPGRYGTMDVLVAVPVKNKDVQVAVDKGAVGVFKRGLCLGKAHFVDMNDGIKYQLPRLIGSALTQLEISY